MQYTSIYYIHDYATIMPVCIYTCNVHRKNTDSDERRGL
jgi:hypothetical protein